MGNSEASCPENRRLSEKYEGIILSRWCTPLTEEFCGGRVHFAPVLYPRRPGESRVGAGLARLARGVSRWLYEGAIAPHDAMRRRTIHSVDSEQLDAVINRRLAEAAPPRAEIAITAAVGGSTVHGEWRADGSQVRRTAGPCSTVAPARQVKRFQMGRPCRVHAS